MTNLKDIEKQLDEEVKRWYDANYDVKLPDTFNAILRRCLMNVPPVQHNMPSSYLRELIVKKDHELTRADVGLALNVIFHSPIGSYAPEGTIEEQLNLLEDMGSIRSEFNRQAKDVAQHLVGKWRRMAKMSGVVIDEKTANYQPKIFTA